MKGTRMKTIKQVLIERDGMSDEEAERLIIDCKVELFQRLSEGETPDDICGEWFGLEPDYLLELM
jgi:hypothetical protein